MILFTLYMSDIFSKQTNEKVLKAKEKHSEESQTKVYPEISKMRKAGRDSRQLARCQLSNSALESGHQCTIQVTVREATRP